tara:strand:+ start:585 stop:770 length:186 start_codon:yes stop_codon:yes gene_type:complete
MTRKIKTLGVSAGGRLAGELRKESQFCFAYDSNVNEGQCVSLTMPNRPQEYRKSVLHPVFE